MTAPPTLMATTVLWRSITVGITYCMPKKFAILGSMSRCAGSSTTGWSWHAHRDRGATGSCVADGRTGLPLSTNPERCEQRRREESGEILSPGWNREFRAGSPAP